MDVRQAVAQRRSTRAFRDTPIDTVLIETLAMAASRAPSGGNLQPWHVDIVNGDAMKRLKLTMLGTLAAGATEDPEYDIYPRDLAAPYRDRRYAIGEALYARLGIPREDKVARRAWFAQNFAFFGAPAALFLTIDRAMGPPQWSDAGMFLQSFMLLAQEEGLATCAQECWAIYPQTVRAFLSTPSDRMLFCGMAIGFADPDAPANALAADRAPPIEWLKMHIS